MAVIPLPDNLFRNARWSLAVPQQVNRSEWTGRRTVMSLPGAARWSVTAEHVPIIGEAHARVWRAFQAQLVGAVNTFRMPATEGPQHAGDRPFIANGFTPDLRNLAGVATVAPAGLSRTATFTAAWDAAGYSFTTLPAPMMVSWRMPQNNAAIIVGLNKTPTSSANYGDIPVSWYLRNDGKLEYAESSASPVAAFVGYSASNTFGIMLTPGVARYFANGALQREVSLATSGNWALDTCFFDLGTVSDIAMGTAVAGVSTLRVAGLPASAQLLPAGAMMTVPLANGDYQLVTLTAELVGNAFGYGSAIFQPPLRGIPAPGGPLETIAPFAVVAFDEPSTGWSVDSGQLYSFALTATEDF